MPRKTRRNGVKRLAKRKSHVPGTRRKVVESSWTFDNVIEIVHVGNSVGIIAYDRDRLQPDNGVIIGRREYASWDNARNAYNSINTFKKALQFAARAQNREAR